MGKMQKTKVLKTVLEHDQEELPYFKQWLQNISDQQMVKQVKKSNENLAQMVNKPQQLISKKKLETKMVNLQVTSVSQKYEIGSQMSFNDNGRPSR